MSLAFGDVVLVPFPFTDQSATKRRPAVVVSSGSYNRHRPDVVVLAITSQIRLPLSFGEAQLVRWREAGLIKPSVFKPLLATIEQAIVIRTLGKLAAEDARTLRALLDAILE